MPNEFINDKGKRLIVTNHPRCHFCNKQFIEGDVAYFFGQERIISCAECMGNDELGVPSMISEFHDVKNNFYYFGIIKIREMAQK